MVSIKEAQRIIGDQQVTLKSKKVPLIHALNSFLAQDIIAPFDLPSYDNSAMDGYAVCGEGHSFKLVGEVAAGDISELAISAGEAVRIFTGGKVPKNTTAVVMQEKTHVDGDRVFLDEEVVAGRNIRKRGSELKEDAKVLHKGKEINPASIGLISSMGISELDVYQKPKVRIIATGNELIQAGQERKEGQIYESNTHSLVGALNRYSYDADQVSSIEDDLERIKKGIEEDLKHADVLLLSGGISVGAYDFVKKALTANGVRELFYKVLQKPGKPLFFGRKGNRFVFALPGNPASSLTCFYLYVLPLLEKLSGGKGIGLRRLHLPLKEEYHFMSDRPTFLKASIENGEVTILDGQGSSMIYSMAAGNALVFLEGARVLAKGESVETIAL